jgi:multidrug efflux pump subunit AcrB
MRDLPPLSDPNPIRPHKGPLAWMAKNSVAANLLMLALIFAGLVFLSRIKQEVFPQFTLDIVSVNIAYPGASPAEVEKAVTKVVEESVRGLDGVKTVTSTSREGVASITVELMLDTNRDRALNDIKAAVDRVTSFPADVERPVVALTEFRSQVLSLIVYGDIPEKSLRALADQTRDQLLQTDGITQAELSAVRPLEISIEVPQENLRRYGLTLDQVATRIRAANVELPAGGIKTERGEILLRTSERRDWGTDFGEIVVVSRPDGTQVRLREIAVIHDAFADQDQYAFFNGKRAAMVKVYRVGDQTPLAVSDRVYEFIDETKANLPPGVDLAVWNDRSEMFRQRIDLLKRNAYMGLGLVLLCLGLFLEIRLAFWVTMGIPISFLGALLFLPQWDVSINMISLFAFIVTLGIVVDDAIVVGEAIYKRRQDGLPPMKAAIVGAHDVAKPVIFSVLTTIVAFSPLLFVPGVMGKFFRNIPTVVIAVLLLSLVESLLVLPAHLSHENPIATFFKHNVLRPIFGERLGPFGWLHRGQQRFSDGFERFIEQRFVPISEVVTRYRYISLAVGFSLLLSSCGFVASGRIEFTFLPKIESDVVVAQLAMPYGTPYQTTEKHMRRILETGDVVFEEIGGRQSNVRGVFSSVGSGGTISGGPRRGPSNSGSHIAEVAVFLKPSDERNVRTVDVVEKWRDKLGQIPGAESLKFVYTTGASGSAPISIQLSHGDVPTLERAAADLSTYLKRYNGVRDVDDGVELGKMQLDFELTAQARALGISERDLARQVRAAFFGAEASRQQRGRDEVRAYVRLPKAERGSLHDLDELMIRTPTGGEIPLRQAANVSSGRSYTSILREDARRVITVEADVQRGKANANKVMADVQSEALPELYEKYPGLTSALGGQQKEQAESLGALFDGFKLALILMFALMAIPFKSYVQPIIIMFAIPFGLVGALAGHLLMGYDLSVLSMMGLVALSGVVVNDSLVLISAVNEFRKQGMTAPEAVVAGAARRFRPILLTSLTTFLGLAPMIFETSVQARFLIPMALSLGFGVLFATFVILLLVPCLYLVIEDIGGAWSRAFGARPPEPIDVDGEGAPAQ